jgi:hypothetical protein
MKDQDIKDVKKRGRPPKVKDDEKTGVINVEKPMPTHRAILISANPFFKR